MASDWISLMYDQMVQTVYLTLIHNYFDVASFAVFMCDFSHTLEREVLMVWPTRICVGKLLYLAVRYTPFIDLTTLMIINFSVRLPPAACEAVLVIMNVSTVIGIAASEGILVMSLYALLGARRSHLIFLTTVTCASVMTTFVLSGFYLRSAKAGPSPYSALPRCWYNFFPLEHAYYIKYCYYLLLAAEIVFTLIAIAFGLKKYLRLKSRLMGILYRDGTFYYIALTGCAILNIAVNLITGYGPLNNLQRVLHSVLASRLFLNTRSTLRPDIKSYSRSGSSSISNIRFAERQPMNTR
ncbi:hypothetical protein CC1G_08903 [Coprinopsis cinerea okayama7|uniref:DUF6533 domain-containing protein n=1 Tax=Coprinopsis cinerea (strain Okayama-7 / 130 / ATCC MYA-4618 / FGSC 9003) TaxID=240176 RepID=A8P896_COPC7|nr:hypothetical protein CC1G_08903 [Coprinopsis cinerea okayama7\|eukprot:XP_001839524.2 hypothetical protein CC1G_08903 [Coprinopsis cinerea okayama7\